MNCLKPDPSVSKLSCLFLSTAKCDYCMVEAQSLIMRWIKHCGQTSHWHSSRFFLLQHLYSYSHVSPFSWLFLVSSVLQHPYAWLTTYSALYSRWRVLGFSVAFHFSSLLVLGWMMCSSSLTLFVKHTVLEVWKLACFIPSALLVKRRSSRHLLHLLHLLPTAFLR